MNGKWSQKIVETLGDKIDRAGGVKSPAVAALYRFREEYEYVVLHDFANSTLYISRSDGAKEKVKLSGLMNEFILAVLQKII